jgi:hypothetical protein
MDYKYFNVDKWPFVYFTTNGTNSIINEKFDDFKREYLSLLVTCKKNNEQIAFICNITSSENFEMKNIMKFANFNKEIYNFNKAYVKCVAILCTDKNFKNILNLYFTFAKPSSPYKLCRSYMKVNKYFKEKWNLSIDSSYYDGYNNVRYNMKNMNDVENDDDEDIGQDYIDEEENSSNNCNLEELKI